MRHWLLKNEPECFSIADLEAAPQRTTFWDGVRNYQARNFLRDDFQSGDLAIYYHSNAEPSAAVGVVKIVRAGYPDHTAQNPKGDHYDPKHTALNPIWYMVDVRHVETFPRIVPLEEMRKVPELKGMELLKTGSRLSVMPITKAEFDKLVKLAHSPAPTPTAAAKKPQPKKKPAAAKSKRS